MHSKLQPLKKENKKSEPIRIYSSLKDVNQIRTSAIFHKFHRYLTERDEFLIEVANCRTYYSSRTQLVNLWFKTDMGFQYNQEGNSEETNGQRRTQFFWGKF